MQPRRHAGRAVAAASGVAMCEPASADPGRLSGRHAGVGGRESRGEQVVIELSQAQVAQVVRSAAVAGNMSVLVSGLEDVSGTLKRFWADDRPQRLQLSRSLLSGLLLLAAFPEDGSYLSIAEVARALDMHPSTIYRYFSTLLAVGLLEQDPGTRLYRLAG
jgi:hypothetical protein